MQDTKIQMMLKQINNAYLQWWLQLVTWIRIIFSVITDLAKGMNRGAKLSFFYLTLLFIMICRQITFCSYTRTNGTNEQYHSLATDHDLHYSVETTSIVKHCTVLYTMFNFY